MTRRYAIIGGVAGGATAAARIRRLDEHAEIMLFERGDHVSYANCGLPYYIGGAISDRNRLFLQTPEGFRRRYRIDARTGAEVTAIERAAKTIRAIERTTGKITEYAYDRLLLSPGAEPLRPPIPGIDQPGIFTVRNVADIDAVKQFIGAQRPDRAVVIGAGFIGCEMAENLRMAGIDVSLVERMDQVLAPLDFEMAAIVHHKLAANGCAITLGDSVAAFEKKDHGNGFAVALASGRRIDADMAILSIGIRPDTGLAAGAGITISERGSIIVNDYLQTSDPDIYAVGDAIEFYHPLLKKSVATFLAGPANKQARIAAGNMVNGNTRTYGGSIGTAIARVFELAAASTGIAAKTARQEKITFQETIVHPASHAGYFPGAVPMCIKLVFNPESGAVLGCQIVGGEGVDKRIDVIASIIKRGGTVADLTEFEQAYAPPYSSAKDAVNVAGFSAENIMTGLIVPATWQEVREKIGDHSSLVLDVRTEREYAGGAIPGAVNIPVDDLRSRLGEIPNGKTIYVYCAVGLRGYLACRILLQNGFTDVRNISGGYTTYAAASALLD